MKKLSTPSSRMIGVTCPLTVCLALAILTGPAPGADKADPSERIVSTWPPKGLSAKIMLSRDNWVSNVGKEAVGNNGGASRWKLKGVQECTLFDADLSSLKGKIVTGCLLHMKCVSPDAPALRVSVSTVATPWVEGAGSSYDEQQGSSCFASPELGKRDWAFPGSTLLDAAWGKGHTIWRFAEATAPDRGGWQAVAVEPDVVAANVAGLAHGFGAMDDVGSIWTYKAEGTFKFINFPNRFFASREQKNAAPYLEVWTDGQDKEPPAAVTDISVETADLPAGQALVKWKTPADTGGGHTLGFNVTCRAGGKEAPVPRYLIPMAGRPGDEVRMSIEDLPLSAGQEIELTIAAVDSAGNVGKSFTKAVKVSDTPAVLPITPTSLKPFEPSDKLPEVGGLKVAVIDLVDKVEAGTGKMVPDHPAGYKGGNHLWSAQRKLVRLQAARNEAVAFQVNLEGKSDAAEVRLSFPAEAGVKTRVYRFDYVQTDAGNMPDALLPLTGALPIPAKDDPQAAGQTNASILCEIYVPHEAAAGKKPGKLTVRSGGATLDLDVELTVWDFTLPDKLSFIPELNCYGTAGPRGNALEYYRIAHEHRCCLNCLNYGWSGAVRNNAAPKIAGESFDWGEYDRDFGPLFDGSAFLDLPRKGEPLDVFYLPINEHWPMNVFKGYTKNYWADEAFTQEYKRGFIKACAEFARHSSEKKWHDTIFELYLNNKVYYKAGKKFESVSALWCLDEPANIQDFWALRWYGILYHLGVDPVRGRARMWYRCDVSRTQFDRDMLWGVLDMEVMGGVTPQKVRMKQDEQRLWARSYSTFYGSANDPKSSNLQPVVWCLSAWADGAVGVLPWQVIGKKESWDKGEATCLFYPTETAPVPSVRLKAFCRGQQDVEYLTLLGRVCGQPAFAVAAGMQKLVDLRGRIDKTGEADAGTIRFDKAEAISLWQLRVSVAESVSAKKPAYQRVLQPMPTPQTDMNRLPGLGYVTVAPKVPSSAPDRE